MLDNKVEIRKFGSLHDFKLLKGWLLARGMSAPHRDELPTTGWTAVWGEEPLGCLFMRVCEGGICSLDGLVTDPLAPSALRDIAIDLLIGKGVAVANESSFRRIVSFSLDGNTLERVKKLGFVHQPVTVVTLSLA